MKKLFSAVLSALRIMGLLATAAGVGLLVSFGMMRLAEYAVDEHFTEGVLIWLGCILVLMTLAVLAWEKTWDD